MVFREDVDIGSFTLGDLHMKSHCVQMRLEGLVENLQHVRSTQLRLFNCGLGLENATEDIDSDIHCTLALLGEEVEKPKETISRITMGFVGEVHDAMSLESLDSIPMHCDFDGVDRISTQDISLTQLTADLQNTPLRFVCRPTPFSPYDILYSLHLCLLLNGQKKDRGFTGHRLSRLQ